MLEAAIRYPWTGEKKVETLLIGGVLSVLGVLFIPVLFVYGYLVTVIREVNAGRDETPPEFDEWTDLLVQGLIAFLISFVYFLVPLLAVGLAAATLILPVTVVEGGGEPSGGIAIGGVLLAIFVVLVAVLISVAAAYLLPAAVAAYAVTERVGPAFSPGTLRSIGGSRSYAIAWLVALAIAILAQIVGGIVAVTVVGALLVPFISFYGNVAGAYAIGTGVRDSDFGQTAMAAETGATARRE